MKFLIERTKYEEHDKYYEVAFTITDEDGYNMYTPVTVFKYELLGANVTEAQIMELATKQVLPGQVALYYSRKPKNDFFDQLEKSITNG